MSDASGPVVTIDLSKLPQWTDDEVQAQAREFEAEVNALVQPFLRDGDVCCSLVMPMCMSVRFPGRRYEVMLRIKGADKAIGRRCTWYGTGAGDTLFDALWQAQTDLGVKHARFRGVFNVAGGEGRT